MASITRTPYAYTGGDPVNGTDPLGLSFLGAITGFVKHVVQSKVFKVAAVVVGVAAIAATGGSAFLVEGGIAEGLGAVADVATVGSTALNGAGCIAETGLDQLASCTGTATGLAGATIGAFAPSAGFWAAQGKTLWQLEFGLYDVVSQSALLASNHVAIGLFSMSERPESFLAEC